MKHLKKTIHCEEATHATLLYTEGRLPRRKLLAWHHHLLTCPACREEYVLFSQMADGPAAYEAPSHFSATVMKRIATLPPKPQPSHSARALKWLACAYGVLLLSLFSLLYATLWGGQPLPLEALSPVWEWPHQADALWQALSSVGIYVLALGIAAAAALAYLSRKEQPCPHSF